MLGIRKYKHMEAFYSVFFLIRRFFFVVLLLSLEAHPAIAVSVLMFLNIAAMIYIGWVQPHDTRASQRLELANDFCFQVICYMIAISMNSSGLHFDKVLGVIMVTLISLLIGVNLLYVMLMTVFSIILKLKFRWSRHQAQKA